MSDLLLPVGLAFIMFSLGLGLRIADFRRVLKRPAVMAAGLLAQVILLPASAFVIAQQAGLEPRLAVGLMILAACPGGVTAGMVTRLAGGDTALSISLTALTSLVAFLSVPLIVGASMTYFLGQTSSVALPVGQLVGGLFVITLLPVVAGLLLRLRGPLRHAVARQWIHRLATLVFLLIVLVTFVEQWDVLTEHAGRVGAATLALNLTTMLTGIGLGVVTGVAYASRIALAMECGIQNAALGITLAVAMLGMPELAVPSVVYALVMNVTALLVIVSRPLLLARGAA